MNTTKKRSEKSERFAGCLEKYVERFCLSSENTVGWKTTRFPAGEPGEPPRSLTLSVGSRLGPSPAGVSPFSIPLCDKQWEQNLAKNGAVVRKDPHCS